MIERIARAIWERRREMAAKVHQVELELWGDGSVPRANHVFEEARAAIEAMREPTTAMLNATWMATKIEGDHPKGALIHKTKARVRYQAMIDEALREDVDASK